MTTKPGISSLNLPTDERREGLTLERFAEVMAYRKFFPAHFEEEVLLRLGIRPARWARAAEAWGEALASAAIEEKPEIVLRFARAFGGTSRKLREWPPRLESLGEPIDPDTPDPEERAPERPSFMLDTPPSRAPQSAGSVWTRYVKSPSPHAAPTPPAPPAPLQAPPPPPPPRTPGLGETADISSFVPRKPLPFQEPSGEDKLAQEVFLEPGDLRKGPGWSGR